MRRPDGTTFRQFMKARKEAGGGLPGAFKDWRSGSPMAGPSQTIQLPGGGTQTTLSNTLNKALGGGGP